MNESTCSTFSETIYNQGYLSHVKVYLNDREIYAFPNYTYYKTHNSNKIILREPIYASNITVKKENAGYDDIHRYTLSFNELEAWCKYFVF